jgi:hypothetical protein
MCSRLSSGAELTKWGLIRVEIAVLSRGFHPSKGCPS